MSDPAPAATVPAPARRERSEAPRAPRDAALWFALLGAPAAWSVDALAAFALHQSYCAALVSHRFVPFSGVGVWMTLVGVLMLTVAAGGVYIGFRARRALGSDTGRGSTHSDRRRFMAEWGFIGSGLFLFGIVLRTAAVFFVSADICRVGS